MGNKVGPDVNEKLVLAYFESLASYFKSSRSQSKGVIRRCSHHGERHSPTTEGGRTEGGAA